MSHTNKTPNYDLPQFIGTDKASWLGDLNPAFLAIDTGMQANKVAAQAAEVSAGEASALAQSANSVANSANNSATKALSEIDNWIEININNPDTTNFVQYNCLLQFNPDLGIASLYNLIEFKDGFTPVLGTSGTPFIILPSLPAWECGLFYPISILTKLLNLPYILVVMLVYLTHKAILGILIHNI